jgi:hypothetical protein
MAGADCANTVKVANPTLNEKRPPNVRLGICEKTCFLVNLNLKNNIVLNFV